MIRVYKDYNEMIAHMRGKVHEIKHEAVKVEDIKKKDVEGKPAEKKGKKK